MRLFLDILIPSLIPAKANFSVDQGLIRAIDLSSDRKKRPNEKCCDYPGKYHHQHLSQRQKALDNQVATYHRHLDKQTACWPSLPACLHCQFTSLAVHHQKWCNLPTHKHQRDWAEKIVPAGTKPPLLPVFVMSGSLAPLSLHVDKR